MRAPSSYYNTEWYIPNNEVYRNYEYFNKENKMFEYNKYRSGVRTINSLGWWNEFMFKHAAYKNEELQEDDVIIDDLAYFMF